MIPEIFEKNVEKHFNANNEIDYFELHYKVELYSDQYSERWEYEPAIVELEGKPNEYILDLSGIEPKEHQIQLKKRVTGSGNIISLEGIIRMIGLDPIAARDHKVGLSVKGGGITDDDNPIKVNQPPY